jgi:hypothetical protein
MCELERLLWCLLTLAMLFYVRPSNCSMSACIKLHKPARQATQHIYPGLFCTDFRKALRPMHTRSLLPKSLLTLKQSRKDLFLSLLSFLHLYFYLPFQIALSNRLKILKFSTYLLSFLIYFN